MFSPPNCNLTLMVNCSLLTPAPSGLLKNCYSWYSWGVGAKKFTNQMCGIAFIATFQFRKGWWTRGLAKRTFPNPAPHMRP